MRIVAGTYEGFCYGWDSTVEPGAGEATLSSKAAKKALQPSLSPSASSPQPLSLAFGYNVHVGCMKSVAMASSGTRAGKLLVTGGADERVRIYDLRDRTELGELQQHNGEQIDQTRRSVTCDWATQAAGSSPAWQLENEPETASPEELAAAAAVRNVLGGIVLAISC